MKSEGVQCITRRNETFTCYNQPHSNWYAKCLDITIQPSDCGSYNKQKQPIYLLSAIWTLLVEGRITHCTESVCLSVCNRKVIGITICDRADMRSKVKVKVTRSRSYCYLVICVLLGLQLVIEMTRNVVHSKYKWRYYVKVKTTKVKVTRLL